MEGSSVEGRGGGFVYVLVLTVNLKPYTELTVA